MDPAAERCIEERLQAQFGGRIQRESCATKGLQTWGTFFRDGSGADNTLERPPSPYTDLFLESLVQKRENFHKRHNSESNQRVENGCEQTAKEQAQAGTKRLRQNDSTESSNEEKASSLRDKDAPSANLDNVSNIQEHAESESDDSEDDDDESSDSSSSPSDAEDGLNRVASFRDQVADNERYRKRIRDAHARTPAG